MSNVSKLKKKAADFEQKKQFDRAVQAYIELLDTLANDIDDADIPLYNRVGDILIRQNSAAEALVYYEKAVDLYSERGFLNNAIALCNKILRQSPGRSVIYYKLGKISATKGFKSDAKRNFLEYADRMEKGGKRDEAFRALKEFADLCPDQDDVRLMLAEHLARDNRKEEAIEQLQTLHRRMEDEGRSAEARATLERMKSIDPDVEPRPSGAYHSIKSNELVFLDIDDVAVSAPSRHTPVPSSRAPEPEPAPLAAQPGIESSNSALDGLTLTFMPAEDQPAAKGDIIEGYTTTGEQAYISADDVARLADFETGRADTAPVDIEFPSLIDLPAVDATGHTPRSNDLNLDSFADETMSGSEFAALDLEPIDAPIDERPHDLALPTELPLIRFTDEVPAVDDAADAAPQEAAKLEGVDLDMEIMSPIARSTAPAQAPDDAFELTEDIVSEALEEAAAALDGEFDAVAPPNEELELEIAAAIAEQEPVEIHGAAPDEPAAAEPEDVAPRQSGHSLEWEDLAAAAAAHDVEPLEVPPPTAADIVAEAREPGVAEIDLSLMDQPATFGGNDTPLPQLSASPLSPESNEAIVVPDIADFVQGVDALEEISAESAAIPEAEQPLLERRTPPQAIAAISLVDTLRSELDASPNDYGLRRRYGEALLETGDRDQGLRELDAAMHGVDREGDLDTALEIANEILRLVPESVRHHQKCVEYAVRSGDRSRLTGAYLALADALFRGGEHDKARAVYGRVVELEPNEARALAAIELLSGDPVAEAADELAAIREVADELPGEDAAEPSFADLELEDLDAEVAAAFQSQDDDGTGYDDDSDGRAGVFQTPAFVAGGGDFIDLGAMLRGDQPSKSTRMVVGEVNPTGDEQADFEDMLRRFKQGVAANVDEEDFDSHYDLGVAFKEMGLIDDAIAQFQKALRSDTHRSRAYEALGQCFVEKGQFQVAATLLARAAETTKVDDRVLVGSLYLLGYALEQLQREREALVYYHRVFAVDVEFRDVASRIRSLASNAAT